MLITDPESLRTAILDIRPSHVAVAYLGAGWKEYLDLDSLTEIIVSPTLGSNPDALHELLDMTWQREISVYFLENLHAKLYIGNDAFLVGSPNLTDNGFGGGLEEAAFLLRDEAVRKQALIEFARLRDRSVADEQRQRKMLESLRETWNRAHWHDVWPIASERRKALVLSDFQPGAQRIHIAWYVALDIDYDEEVIRTSVSGIGQHAPDSYFKDAMTFAGDDDVREGDWLLCWHSNDDGTPRRNGRIYWMQVNLVIPSGARDEITGAYTLVAATRHDYNPMPEPFSLDRSAKRLIRNLLASNDYLALSGAGNEVWRARDVVGLIPLFLADLKRAYCEEVAAS